MHRFCSVLAGLLLAPALTMAQQQPAAADPNAAMTKFVLEQWEKAMTGMNTVETECARTTINKVFKTVETYTGSAKLLKSTNANQPVRASLELFKQGRPEVYEKIICTGTIVYVYDPTNKVIKWYNQPAPGQGNLNDNNFLDFLFGMKANDLAKRYDITYVPQDPKADAAKFYHYLRILPKAEQDKQTFKEARVALNINSQNAANNFLPRQLWFLQSNNNEVTWDFPRMTPNAPLRPQQFMQPDLPGGWKLDKGDK
jgi:TIGR03009 family protein